LSHDVVVSTKDVISFCRICNAMCGIIVTVEGTQILQIRGDEHHPLSRGYTCPKGRALGAFHHHPQRLDHHHRRRAEPAGGTDQETISQENLVTELADLIRTTIAEHGPSSVGMYLASGSAFDTNGRRAAERFLSRLGSFQKYTATTIDTPCKPLVAELVGGWSGLTPIWDHEHSNLLLLFGSNPIVSHGHSNAISDPVRRIREFRERGGVVIVADPRRTETAAASDLHLQLNPGSDFALLGFIVRDLLSDADRRYEAAQRVEGLDRLIAAVEPFTAGFVARLTALSEPQLEDMLDAVRSAGRLSALTGTGTSMSSAANSTEWLLWALHIITDSADRRGGMWFNPGFLMQFDSREWVASSGEPEAGPASRPELPRRFGEYPCAALASEIESGQLRILLVVGGNPITALPDTERTRAALSSLDALVVLDVVETETTALATHVVAVAGQLERADLPWLLDAYQLAVATQYTPAVVAPQHERVSTWRFFAELGAELGFEVLPRGINLESANEDLLLDDIMRRSRSTPESIREARHGVVASGAVFGWVHERVLPHGKWRIAPQQLVDQLGFDLAHFVEAMSRERTESPDRFILVPQRRLRTMNSQFRDVSAPGARLETPSAELSDVDCARLGLGEGDRVRITSEHGELIAVTHISTRVAPGCVGVPHGWSVADVSRLTSADVDVDQHTGMIRQSGLPVRISKLG
jgi:anaerobic selenocysteine-containing dehydrogenase